MGKPPRRRVRSVRERQGEDSERLRRRFIRYIHDGRIQLLDCQLNTPTGVKSIEIVQARGLSTDNSVLKVCFNDPDGGGRAPCSKPAVVKIMPHTNEFSAEIEDSPATVEQRVATMFTNEVLVPRLVPNLEMIYGTLQCAATTRLINQFPYLRLRIRYADTRSAGGRMRSEFVAIISEYIHGMSLAKFMERYAEAESVIPREVTRSILFGILSTLAVLQLKYHFMHYDMHANNIMIDTAWPRRGVQVLEWRAPSIHDTMPPDVVPPARRLVREQTFVVPNGPTRGIISKVRDFDFCTVLKRDEDYDFRIENAKVTKGPWAADGVVNAFTPYHDVFRLCIWLVDSPVIDAEAREFLRDALHPDVYNEDDSPNAVHERDMLVESYADSRARGLLKTPDELILFSPYFKKYRRPRHATRPGQEVYRYRFDYGSVHRAHAKIP